MRYSIITPTILRGSLIKLCQTINVQSSNDWEHIIMADTGPDDVSDEQQKVLQRILSEFGSANYPRQLFFCEQRHNNWGNTCRHRGWERSAGEYVLYLDDDKYLADFDVLKTLEQVSGSWALFPINRFGERFFNIPPGCCRTDGAGFITRREFADYPDSDIYEADGLLADKLRDNQPYQIINERELVIMPKYEGDHVHV